MAHRRWLVGLAAIVALFLILVVSAVAGEAPSESAALAMTPWFVDDDACPGPGTGSSGDPFCRIQDAVDAAGTGDQIRVAGGTYTGSHVVMASNGYSHTQVVYVTKTLTLLGGYGPGWSVRDPAAYPTTIDAERMGRGVTIYGDDAEVMTVTGFIVTGGDYTGLGNPDGAGNAVCLQASYDCGGGIFVHDAGLILHDSIVRDNIASTDGGDGGGIYLWDTDDDLPCEIKNVQIISNSTSGSQADGGGIHSYRIEGGLRIEDSLIQGNTAGALGGGIFLYDCRSLIEIVDSSIMDNEAGVEAGGAYIRLSYPGELLSVDRVVIQGNEADRYTGLYLAGSGGYQTEARFANVVFAQNSAEQATTNAAVIGISGFSSGLTTTFAHVTAADNDSPTFLYLRPTADEDPVTVILSNTILASFSNAFVLDEDAGYTQTLRHSHTFTTHVENLHLVEGGAPVIVALNQLRGDPMLDSTYHLKAGSPAIDAGEDTGVTSDIDRDHRPLGKPDIGADEWWHSKAFLPLAMRG
jgi:hypothetical protein